MLIKYAFLLLLSIYMKPTLANIISLPNSQTKNQKSADLAEVQLPDAEAYNKLNENGERILRRKIAPTDTNTSVNSTLNNGNDAVAINIATEATGATKLDVPKIGMKNGTNIVKEQHVEMKGNANKTVVSSTPASAITSTLKSVSFNGTTSIENNIAQNISVPQNKTLTTTTKPSPTSTAKSTTSTTTSTSTTTTTTTSSTSTTTTTTTPKPKKPTRTYSIEDNPEIANVIPQHSSSSKFPTEPKSPSPKLSVDEPEQPIAQPSQEFDGGLYRNHRDYIIPIVSIIFAVPILMGMVIVAYRRFRDFWSTRHYRRMDFLVDGMYND